MERKQFEVSIKEAGEQDGEHYIIAYASTFHKDPDSYGDIVAPGAFKGTLERWKESGNPIPLLYGHRMDDPLYNIGHITEAEEDETGLKVRGVFDTSTERGAYAAKLAAESRLTKLSFAYDVLDAARVTLEDGTKANELRELELYEVSLVVVPANSHAEVIEAKAGRRNSAADEDTLRGIIDGLSAAIESINGLLDISETDGNDEPETETEEPTEVKAEEAEEPTEAKADVEALVASIDSFINRMERSQ